MADSSLYIVKTRLTFVMTVFTLVMLAIVSVFCNFFSAIILRISALRAVGAELSYNSAYCINYSVTYLYITAYHFLGPLIYITIIKRIGSALNIHIAFVISIALSAIVPLLASSLIYAAFIYDPDTDRQIGLLRGLHIAVLVAAVIVPILLVIAFVHSFIPA